MIPYFLRSLASTMSRRFPVTTAGDPHVSPSAQLHLHSAISLLTLPSPASAPPPAPAPLEHLDLRTNGAYLAYLQATHLTPLHVLQALLPLLRASPARARDALANGSGKHSIVVCLPATDARVGLLLFDEPSASLDPAAEHGEYTRIQTSRARSVLMRASDADLFGRLRELRGNKTMVFSSHRFGNLTRHADLIL